jgi:D-alanyl-D-alanine carboxypeptidase/D-alanyl-D-alanine-endopeptidase (penicillin-binding protein 4)
MWDDLDRSFATGVGALQFNENTAQLTFVPGPAIGTGAFATSAPPGAGLIVRNLVKTGERGSATSITTERLPGDPALEARGSVPLDGMPVVRNVSVLNPTLYFVNELRSALAASGIEVREAASDIDDVNPSSPFSGTTLLSYRSPPLSTLAKTMMRLSQNLYAETLLRTLGASEGAPTASGGTRAVQSVLSSWGVPESGYSQADGSGLSRYDYVTAETLVAVLMHADRDVRLRDAFVDTLPVAGRDGTLVNRMKGTAADGNARAKTGSMTFARALAGYVTTADDEPLAFAIMANNFGAATDLVDQTVAAIVVKLAEFSRVPRREPAAAAR